MSPRKRRAARVSELRPSEQAALLERLAERRDAVGEAVRAEIEHLVAGVDPDAPPPGDRGAAGDARSTRQLVRRLGA